MGSAATLLRVELEPVSPELVLVDPELARAERARLSERAQLEAYTREPVRPKLLSSSDIEAIRRAVDTTAGAAPLREGTERVRLSPVGSRLDAKVLVALVAGAALLGSGVWAALLLTGTRETAAPTPRSTVQSVSATGPAAQATDTGAVSASSAGNGPDRAISPPTGLRDRHAVERRILSLLFAAPAGKLPARLVDKATGLPKNNVQAICRRSGSRSFACVVHSAQHVTGEGLYVDYRRRRRGSGVFAWHGYRAPPPPSPRK
jgi:hypothetical protein